MSYVTPPDNLTDAMVALGKRSDAPDVEMPKYESHKKVWALKIAAIEGDGIVGGFRITPEDAGYAPFLVEDAYVIKHNPQIGGYYVVYADGYKSFSPAEAFEDGYTRV